MTLQFAFCNLHFAMLNSRRFTHVPNKVFTLRFACYLGNPNTLTSLSTGRDFVNTRRYPKSFVAKLDDAEAEVAETQVWLDYALACNYINLAEYKPLYEKYEHIIAMLITIYTTNGNYENLYTSYTSYYRTIVLSLNRAYFWFACNERDFSEVTHSLHP